MFKKVKKWSLWLAFEIDNFKSYGLKEVAITIQVRFLKFVDYNKLQL